MYTHKMEWLSGYNWQWVEESDSSEKLGTLFGLNVNTSDVNRFFYGKIERN